NAGRLAVRGTPLDMAQVNLDSYVVAGLTDHITPWHGCYNTAQLYGGGSTFLASHPGHIPRLVHLPRPPHALLRARPPGARAGAAGADAWLEQAAKQSGSWWPHWLDWVKARSGATAAAPAALGSARYVPLGAAPGRYVMER